MPEQVIPEIGVASADVSPEGSGAQVVVLGVRPGDGQDPGVHVAEQDIALVAGWGVDLVRRLTRASANGARGETTWIELERDEPRSVLVLGLGGGSAADLRRAAAVAARRLRGVDSVLVLATRDVSADRLRAFTEGILLATPTPTWATSTPTQAPVSVILAAGDVAAGEAAVAAGRAHALASLAARTLIHTPPNLLDPAGLAEHARSVGAHVGLDVRVRELDELVAGGFGGLVAVGAGSAHPPRLVQLECSGESEVVDGADGADRSAGAGGQRHVVLVGKGITFDSGGLSLKKPDMQMGMKTDMSGAAVVCSVLAALPGRLPAGLRVTGLLCLAENLPGAAATRPDDVVTHHGGRTSEVSNTDAEGRLVLGDGLALAVGALSADVVVDIATLTGAATQGLGRRYAALYATSDVLAESLHEAGEAAGELMWRMPLHEGYRDQIHSDVADAANASRESGIGPGSITAALFLQGFVGSTPWAHLDIAGAGRSEADREDLPKGGTGYGARALLRWLEAGAPA